MSANAALIKEFETLLGKENVLTSETDLHSYSYDAAVLDSKTPALVLRPTNSEVLGKAVALCNENELKITVRGAGTNLSGGTIPHPGGVVILTNALNKILEINEQDLYARVQPGVVTAQFAAEVAARGLFYPPDPGSQAVSHPRRQRRRERRRPARPEIRRDQGTTSWAWTSSTWTDSWSSPAPAPSSASPATTSPA